MGEDEYPALDPVFQRELDAAKGVEQPCFEGQVSSIRPPSSPIEYLMASKASIDYGYVASLNRAPCMPVAHVAGYYGSPIILTDASDAQFAAFAASAIQVLTGG